MHKNFIPILVLPLLLGGCAGGNWNSISRDFNVTENKSQLIDVKQRAVLVNKVEGDIRVCAEPSPDALSAYATAFAAQASDRAGDTGSLTASNNEAASVIGTRTPSVTVMRDAYYRACEAYMGGAVNMETYDNLIRRLNTQAIAYLAIEQITSTSAKAAPVTVAPADLASLTDAVTTASANLVAAQDVLASDKKKAAALDKVKDADALNTLNTKIAGDNTDIASKQAALNDTSSKLAGALKPSVTDANGEPTPTNVTAATITAAKEIALDIVNADYSPSMCFAHEMHKKAPSTSGELDTYCTAVLTNQAKNANDLQRAQIDAITAHNGLITSLAAAIAKNCSPADGKPGDACAKFLTATGAQNNAAGPGQVALPFNPPPVVIQGITPQTAVR